MQPAFSGPLGSERPSVPTVSHLLHAAGARLLLLDRHRAPPSLPDVHRAASALRADRIRLAGLISAARTSGSIGMLFRDALEFASIVCERTTYEPSVQADLEHRLADLRQRVWRPCRQATSVRYLSYARGRLDADNRLWPVLRADFDPAFRRHEIREYGA